MQRYTLHKSHIIWPVNVNIYSLLQYMANGAKILGDGVLLMDKLYSDGNLLSSS
jgi:hypothetical protein